VARAKDPIIEAALDLAWSHWTGLGVRGVLPPPDTAVDPEALVYLTALLAGHDPRLADEATDWWCRFQRHVSKPRLTRLADQFTSTCVAKLEAFDAAARGQTKTSGKSRIEDLRHPARALLRLRCAFGTNARAEILLALLTQWANALDGVTALALSEVGYGKRNIALTLDDLRLAGLVATSEDANRLRYRLADAASLRTMLAPLPTAIGRWHLRMPLVAGFVELTDRLRGKDPLVQAVEARKHVTGERRRIRALGLVEPAVRQAEDDWPQLQRWLIDKVIAQPGSAARELPRMIVGAWIGPGQEVRVPERPTGGLLPPIASDPDGPCLDLVQVQTADDWAWAVLSDAGTDVYQHAIGLSRGERWRFATNARGKTRLYAAEAIAPLPPDQIAARYGDVAAAHARQDRPALQLRLRPITR
jgi:hypothetical protein